jgi:hypothetical protein
MFDAQSVHPYGSFWLDVCDKAIKAIAVIVAGFWTYFNYEKSRTYKSKLEPSVVAEIFQKDGVYYALVECSLKNVGKSKFPIRQTGTALAAVALRPNGREDVALATVFEDHAWIEPEERISDPRVLPIPNPVGYVALMLELRILSETRRAFRSSLSIEWNAKTVLKSVSPAEEINFEA